MTPRKKWPHGAEWARMDAISAIESVMADILRIIDSDMSILEIVRKLAVIVSRLRKAQESLKECRK